MDKVYPRKILFQPLNGMTLFTILGVTACLALGIWQVKRLFWKENLLSFFAQSDVSSFKTLAEAIKDLKTQDFSKVQLSGYYRHDLEIKIISRTYKGKIGAYLVTPLVIEPRKAIFINRGWIPEKIALQEIKRPKEKVKVTGFLRKSEKPGFFSPPNDADQNKWYTLDLDEIIQFFGRFHKTFAKSIVPFYVIESPNSLVAESYPTPIDIKSRLTNNHLGYALTWFSLAFALILVYIRYVRSCYWQDKG